MKYIFIIDKRELKYINIPEESVIENVGKGNNIYKNLIKVISDVFMDLEKICYKKLELKSYCQNNNHLDYLRIKFLEYKLNFKNIKQRKYYNLKDNRCYISYYLNNNSLLVKNNQYYKLIEQLSIFNEGDRFISADPANNKINEQKYKDLNLVFLGDFLYCKNCPNSYFYTLDKDNLNNIYLPDNKDKILKYLNNKTINDTIVYQGKDDMKNIRNIEQNIFPYHQLMKKNKFKLFEILREGKIKFDNLTFNYYLSHNRLPFDKEDDTSQILKKYYETKNKGKQTIINNEDKAVCLVLNLSKEKKKWLMTKELDKFIVHHEQDESVPEKGDIEESKKDLLKYFYGNCKPKMSDLSLKNLVNLHKIGNFVFLQNPEKPFISTPNNLPIPLDKIVNVGNDHLGYHDKQPFIKGNQEEKNLPAPFYHSGKIMITYEQGDTICIEVSFDNNIYLLCDKFYIGDNSTSYLSQKLRKLWIKGLFISEFGKNHYKNHKELIPETITYPQWLVSQEDESLKKIFIFLSQF